MRIEEIINELQEYHNDVNKLLQAAKCSLSNQIGHCNKDGCTADTPCKSCSQSHKLWDKIDEFEK